MRSCADLKRGNRAVVSLRVAIDENWQQTAEDFHTLGQPGGPQPSLASLSALSLPSLEGIHLHRLCCYELCTLDVQKQPVYAHRKHKVIANPR